MTDKELAFLTLTEVRKIVGSDNDVEVLDEILLVIRKACDISSGEILIKSTEIE